MLYNVKVEEAEGQYVYYGEWHVLREGWVEPLKLDVRSTMPAGVVSRVVDYLCRELIGVENVATVGSFELKFTAEGPSEMRDDIASQYLVISSK